MAGVILAWILTMATTVAAGQSAVTIESRHDARKTRDDAIALLKLTDGVWQPWTVHADGSDLRQIARMPVDISRITLSRDGRELLANGTDGRLFLVDTRKGRFETIQVEPSAPTDAALSPDGRQIAYSVNTLGGVDSNDLWLVRSAGGRAERLTNQPYLQHFPVWTPDGQALLYLSGRGGQTHDIWRVAVLKKETGLVLGEHLYNFEPAVSIEGDIAFSSNREGGYDIWLLDAGAKSPRRITLDPGYEGQPSFSPDGRFVAFLSRRGTEASIRLHEIATGAESVVPVKGQVRLPVWYEGAS
jgi:TolB protein